jgi:2-isopropylmalate synthase
MRHVAIFDTTLRDGNQAEGIALSIQDKLRIAERLDDFGVAYIEGGWPNDTNPKDVGFFTGARKLTLRHAKIVAFGSTMRAGNRPEEDATLRFMLDAETPAISLFGKSWSLHTDHVLRISREENLRLIEESIRYLRKHDREVIYDAEHFFDGYKDDPEYALATLRAAEDGGANCLVLCDTNGGMLPDEVAEIVGKVVAAFSTPVGIHAHNDSGCAVANSCVAVRAGASHVQGTFNGYGERCGNADLSAVIPNLELKLGVTCLPEGALQRLRSVSWFVSEIANEDHHPRAPYVGSCAFAHKGGMHIDAVRKVAESFEHVQPESVGGVRRILLSDQSGGSTVVDKLGHIEPGITKRDPRVGGLLRQLKEMENAGYQYEAAEASFELVARRALGEEHHLFELLSYRATIEMRQEDAVPRAEATIRVRVGNTEMHTASYGDGPVDALSRALRKALLAYYPDLVNIRLIDYKVRVLTADEGTAAQVRVLIQTGDDEDSWGTVGVSHDIIEASWHAFVDSLTYGLLKRGGWRPLKIREGLEPMEGISP